MWTVKLCSSKTKPFSLNWGCWLREVVLYTTTTTSV